MSQRRRYIYVYIFSRLECHKEEDIYMNINSLGLSVTRKKVEKRKDLRVELAQLVWNLLHVLLHVLLLHRPRGRSRGWSRGCYSCMYSCTKCSEAGSCSRFIVFCIPQLQAQGPSRTCIESNDEKEDSCTRESLTASFLQISNRWVEGVEFGTYGLGLRVLGFRVWGLGFRVQGLGVRICGQVSRFWV